MLRLQGDLPNQAAGAQAEPLSTVSFDEMYQRFATDVLRVCYFYLGNREQAEDVCQDVFVRLYTKKPQLTAGKEKQWLLKVALNRCRDLWRSGWMKRMVLGSPAFELYPAPDEVGQLADKEALMSAVNALSPALRETIILHYYQGFSIVDIAQMMRTTEGTVSSRLSRARGQLEKLLNQQEAQQGGTLA